MLEWFRRAFGWGDEIADGLGKPTHPTLVAPPSLKPPPVAEPSQRQSWHDRLPPYVTFVDVETTGLHATDRLVSLAAIRLTTGPLIDGTLDLAFMHLIFDPGRKSHRKAEEVHGYSDWILRHQEPFETYAETIWKFVHRAPVIVAHNASFDLPFIDREFRAAGCPPVSRSSYCTMQAYKALGIGGSASLSAPGSAPPARARGTAPWRTLGWRCLLTFGFRIAR